MKSFLLATLGALLVCTVNLPAQTGTSTGTSTPPPDGPPGGDGGGGWHHHNDMSFLTDAEKAELKSAHEAALTANPDLAKQLKDFHDQMKEARESGEPPDPSMREQGKTLHDELDAAMIKADANVAPIIAKIKAHHKDGAGGPPPGDGPPPEGPPPGQSGN